MPENLLTPSYGLTNGKLELANATAAQVMFGRTFYAGNKELKTGTLSLTGNASTGDVKSGKTFYSNSFTRQSGTLSLSGNATTSDVASGKTFYSNSFTRQTGTLSKGEKFIAFYIDGVQSMDQSYSNRNFIPDTSIIQAVGSDITDMRKGTNVLQFKKAGSYKFYAYATASNDNQPSYVKVGNTELCRATTNHQLTQTYTGTLSVSTNTYVYFMLGGYTGLCAIVITQSQ